MEHDPRVAPYSTGDQNSFAYVSARDRWPVILTGAIDDVHRAVSARTSPDEVKEGKTIIENLAKLKYELQHDRALTPLIDDGGPDIPSYNAQLSALSSEKQLTWFSTPWLFAECYLYRHLQTLFSTSANWKTYDVFAKQKLSTFRSSRAAVIELASRYRSLILELESGTSSTGKSPEEVATAEKLLFTEMAEICLWGNATDLSLLTSLTYEDIQKLQGSKARKESEKNILVNDLPAAYEALKASQKEGKPERRVNIVLDNSGFELFVDLILSGYLVASNLATRVVLHGKIQPWFVSDVTPPDFAALLNALADPRTFFESPSEEDTAKGRAVAPLSEKEVEDIGFLFKHLAGLHEEGKLGIRAERVWTGPGSFWRLPFEGGKEEGLWEDLKSSELVVFKGDLNYRKLTGDVMWPPTTSFPSAIGPASKPGSGFRALALRTCKADVVVGLSEGQDEEVKKLEGDAKDSLARKWAWSGRWAVVQFCGDGKQKK